MVNCPAKHVWSAGVTMVLATRIFWLILGHWCRAKERQQQAAWGGHLSPAGNDGGEGAGSEDVTVPGSAIKMAISSQIQWFVIIFPSKNHQKSQAQQQSSGLSATYFWAHDVNDRLQPTRWVVPKKNWRTAVDGAPRRMARHEAIIIGWTKIHFNVQHDHLNKNHHGEAPKPSKPSPFD